MGVANFKLNFSSTAGVAWFLYPDVGHLVSGMYLY